MISVFEIPHPHLIYCLVFFSIKTTRIYQKLKIKKQNIVLESIYLSTFECWTVKSNYNEKIKHKNNFFNCSTITHRK